MDADLIRRQIDQSLITTDKLLAGAKFIDESSKECGEYLDSRYFPFYYHLGKQIEPKTVCQIGSKIGLVGACFLRSCKTVESWLAMDHERGHVANITTSNLKLNTKYKNNILPGPIGFMGLNDSMLEIESTFQYDLCFLSEDFGKERYLKHLNFLWKILNQKGLLVADYINSHDVFHEFCRVKNREPIIFETRYGVGIIER